MSCRDCRHFCNDPAAVERALPGLAVLSSAHASVWEGNGLCLAYDIVTNGRRRCVRFAVIAACN